MRPIRVLICDDSALVRGMLREILGADPEIEVVGHAADAFAARDKIKKLNPDVLTLDVEMPKMDGISFLKNLMRLRPMPVVMISSLTQHGAAGTLEALELGAIDYVAKPSSDLAESLPGYAAEIVAKVKLAAQARVRPLPPGIGARADGAQPSAAPARLHGAIELIAVGASTGGTEAIMEFLTALPPDLPPILIVQHIPRAFSAAFAKRLDLNCALRVRQAEAGEAVLPGRAYVAPGDRHLRIRRDGDRLACQLDAGARINQHRPSVDALFDSAAHEAGAGAIGILMTGMGADGAAGMAQLYAAGAATIAQDEQTCVIWGMPREAITRGCVTYVEPLPRIADRVRALVGQGRGRDLQSRVAVGAPRDR